jgi:hypothetical protein
VRDDPARPGDGDGAFLQVRIASLPLLTFPLKSEELLVTVSEFGQFNLPAGIFSGSAALPTALFTGVPLIDGLALTGLANAPQFVGMTSPVPAHPPCDSAIPPPPDCGVLRRGGAGAGWAAWAPLQGNAFLNVLGVFDLEIPLSVVGSPGAFLSTRTGSLTVSVIGTAWTVGPVTVTGLSTVTTSDQPFPSFRIFEGQDGRTRDGLGRMSLVSPFKVVTNATGNLSGVARQTLTFIPEPGGLALRITAALALVACGWLRTRR